jgi:hypothetical protein
MNLPTKYEAVGRVKNPTKHPQRAGAFMLKPDGYLNYLLWPS